MTRIVGRCGACQRRVAPPPPPPHTHKLALGSLPLIHKHTTPPSPCVCGGGGGGGGDGGYDTIYLRGRGPGAGPGPGGRSRRRANTSISIASRVPYLQPARGRLRARGRSRRRAARRLDRPPGPARPRAGSYSAALGPCQERGPVGMFEPGPNMFRSAKRLCPGQTMRRCREGWAVRARVRARARAQPRQIGHVGWGSTRWNKTPRRINDTRSRARTHTHARTPHRRVRRRWGRAPRGGSTRRTKTRARVCASCVCVRQAAVGEDAAWGEHEVDYILIAVADVTTALNPNEVSEIRSVPIYI